MNTDPIADLLTRLRNAVQAKHEKTTVPHSKLKEAILQVLKRKGYIEDFKVEKGDTFKEIIIILKADRPNIHLKKISKPGQRIYIKKADMKPILNGYGIALVSTSKGVMTTDEAKAQNMGGELLCEAW